jgi:hypothetical protein
VSRRSFRLDNALNALVLDEDGRRANALGRNDLSRDEGLESHDSGASADTF